MNNTVKHGMRMPSYDDVIDIADLNYNFEVIDGKLEKGAPFIGTTTGTNVYTVTTTKISSYVEGEPFLVRFATANTSECSLNVNGYGAKNIVRNTNADLLSGDITANSIHLLVYDGVNFQIISQGAKLTTSPIKSYQNGNANFQSQSSAIIYHSTVDVSKSILILYMCVTGNDPSDSIYISVPLNMVSRSNSHFVAQSSVNIRNPNIHGTWYLFEFY